MKLAVFLLAAIYSGIISSVPPPNDNFVNSIHIVGDITIMGNNVDATIEPGEPVHTPFLHVEKSVWWTWTAPANGEYTFEANSPAFLTLIGVYTGNSLTNLTKASLFQGLYTHVTVQQSVRYHIMVASGDNNTGNITLKCYNDPLSADIIKKGPAKKRYYLHASRKGDILYEPYIHRRFSFYRTNRYGYHFSSRSYGDQTSLGMTLITGNGTVILSNSLPATLSLISGVYEFDGKYLYAYEYDSKKLIVFKIKKNGLVEYGSQVISNLYSVYKKGSAVIVKYIGMEGKSFIPLQGLTAFNTKLTRTAWEVPLVRGAFDSFSDKGIYRHTHRGEYAYQLSIHKKGKKRWTHAIPYKTKQLQHFTDDKGNTLYWYYIYNYPHNTNEPLTLISSKGKIILDNTSLPNAGNIWLESNYRNNRFFVSPPAPGNTKTVYGYKLGKKIKESEPVTVDFLSSLWFYGKNLTVMQVSTMPPYVYGMTQYDAKLKKIQLAEPMADGVIRYVDDDVYMRVLEVIGSGKTNLQIKIFGPKGTIAEHVITR